MLSAALELSTLSVGEVVTRQRVPGNKKLGMKVGKVVAVRHRPNLHTLYDVVWNDEPKVVDSGYMRAGLSTDKT